MRDRVRSSLVGRGRVVALAAVGLLGLGIAGGAVATLGDDSTSPTTIAVADQQARIDAASRADRALRSPVAIPTVNPTTAAATPTATEKAETKSTKKAAPATKKATPKATTAKPKAAGPVISKAGWTSPMPGSEITSCFGMRWGVPHQGIDFAMPENTPERAAAAGTVIAAGWAYTGYGISVVIDHGDGYFTHYAHQNRTAVEVGQQVKAGQIIGYEGSTGDSTGPHLHFEVHQGAMWNQIDPAPFLKAKGVPINGC
ncbi:M23 family metallopeptidase [Asanoa iriomotensis]|uniref:M23 family metallopeptidase n=1 Tax=Asanoa iriomotensis TaxID=234613 RepID=UPI001EF3CCC2|nr:M23 family metallopeptidase [Asanoa iriomotensis]